MRRANEAMAEDLVPVGEAVPVAVRYGSTVTDRTAKGSSESSATATNTL